MSVWLPESRWLTRPGLGQALTSCRDAVAAGPAIRPAASVVSMDFSFIIVLMSSESGYFPYPHRWQKWRSEIRRHFRRFLLAACDAHHCFLFAAPARTFHYQCLDLFNSD